MLTLALAATLIGFVLLVLGLITGNLALAVACIVVCVLGLGFLIADIVRGGRSDDNESTAGSSPTGEPRSVADEGRGTAADTGVDATESDIDEASVHAGADDSWSRSALSPTAEVAAPEGYADDSAGSYSAQAGAYPDDPGAYADEAAVTAQLASPTAAAADGTYADYLRSVGADPEVEASADAQTPPTEQIPIEQASTGMWGGDASDTEAFPVLVAPSDDRGEQGWSDSTEGDQVTVAKAADTDWSAGDVAAEVPVSADLNPPETDPQEWNPQDAASHGDEWRGWPQPSVSDAWPERPGGAHRGRDIDDPVFDAGGSEESVSSGSDQAGQKFDPLDPNWRPPR